MASFRIRLFVHPDAVLVKAQLFKVEQQRLALVIDHQSRLALCRCKQAVHQMQPVQNRWVLLCHSQLHLRPAPAMERCQYLRVIVRPIGLHGTSACIAVDHQRQRLLSGLPLSVAAVHEVRYLCACAALQHQLIHHVQVVAIALTDHGAERTHIEIERPQERPFRVQFHCFFVDLRANPA